jgi:hypothetical protein
MVLSIQVLRSLLLPHIRAAAATIMHRLLQQGGINIQENFSRETAPAAMMTSTTGLSSSSAYDLLVHDASFWLDWMSDGLVAIGESYVSGQWELHPQSQETLDSILLRLLTLPVDARRYVTHLLNSSVEPSRIILRYIDFNIYIYIYITQSFCRPICVTTHYLQKGMQLTQSSRFLMGLWYYPDRFVTATKLSGFPSKKPA